MEERSDYYMWLLDRVGVLHGEYSNYLLLMKHLFSTNYIPVLLLDQNRAQGGMSLRNRYATEEGIYIEDVHDGPCSVLEMIEAISEDMAYKTSDSISRWFWELLGNLGLSKFTDENYDHYAVDYIVNRWMNREHDEYGNGTLFPLRNSSYDTRDMQIWDQMNWYMIENYPTRNSW